MASWMTQRRLIQAEAVLLIGAGTSLLQDKVVKAQLPPWVAVLFAMALTVGLLGALLAVVQHWAERGVGTSQQMARRLPAGVWIGHVAAFIALFALYDYTLGTGVVDGVLRRVR